MPIELELIVLSKVIMTFKIHLFRLKKTMEIPEALYIDQANTLCSELLKKYKIGFY